MSVGAPCSWPLGCCCCCAGPAIGSYEGLREHRGHSAQQASNAGRLAVGACLASASSRSRAQGCTAPLQEYYEVVRKHKAYLALEANKSGSRPKELYGDCIEEVEERFGRERAQLKEAVRKHDISISEDSTLEAFTAALRESDDPQNADIQEVHRWAATRSPAWSVPHLQTRDCAASAPAALCTARPETPQGGQGRQGLARASKPMHARPPGGCTCASPGGSGVRRELVGGGRSCRAGPRGQRAHACLVPCSCAPVGNRQRCAQGAGLRAAAGRG